MISIDVEINMQNLVVNLYILNNLKFNLIYTFWENCIVWIPWSQIIQIKSAIQNSKFEWLKTIKMSTLFSILFGTCKAIQEMGSFHPLSQIFNWFFIFFHALFVWSAQYEYLLFDTDHCSEI